MTTFAADDFAEIARRMRGLRGLRESESVRPECARCEGRGWAQVFSPYPPPMFAVCLECFNPKGQPSP